MSMNSYYNTGAYPAYKWAQYVSINPNARTLTRFHLILEARMLNPRDYVRLVGSVDPLDNEGNGVVMETENGNPLVWTVAVELPFTKNDYCAYGMFQFHYEIVSGSDGRVHVEGQGERSEQRLRSNFYHGFRPDYRNVRFRNVAALSVRYIICNFGRNIFAMLKTGLIEVEVAMEKLSCLIDCTPGSSRTLMEELFEEDLDEYENSGWDMPDSLMLAYLAAIGKFGLTSSEKVYVAQNYGYGAYNFGFSEAPVVKYRTPPAPTMWSHYCIEKLSVPDLFSQNWRSVLGNRYYLAVLGLVEATERLSEHGFYSWLRIYPLLRKHSTKPRIVHHTAVVAPRKGKKRSAAAAAVARRNAAAKIAEDDFSDSVHMICALIDEQQILAAELETRKFAQQRAGVTGLGGVHAPAKPLQPGEQLPLNPPPQQAPQEPVLNPDDEDFIGLAELVGPEDDRQDVNRPRLLIEKWLAGIVLHSPTLTHLSVLMNADLSMHAQAMVTPFADRLVNESLNEEKALNILREMLLRFVTLQDPRVASALFRNETADSWRNQVIELCRICLLRNQQMMAEMSLRLADNADHLEGDLLEVNSAAKDWIRRIHGTEPVLPDDSPPAAPQVSSWYQVLPLQQPAQKPKKKALSDTEQIISRRTSLQLALGDVDNLLTIPLFQRFPQGLLFELGRCWFYGGPVQQVVEALFSVGNGVQAFAMYSPTLAQNQLSKTIKFLKEAAPTQRVTLSIARLAKQSLASNSELLHLVLYHLLVYSTWPESMLDDQFNAVGSPSLRAMLDQDPIWKVFVETVHTNQSAPASLISLAVSGGSVLARVVERLVGDTVCIAELKVLGPKIDSFVELVELFRCGGKQFRRDLLEQRLLVLNNFDKTLEEVQTYLSFFCSCGVRIESDSVRTVVDSLHSRYNDMESRALPMAFDGIRALPHIRYLFDLRSSELFFQLWRRVGKEVSMEVAGVVQAEMMENPVDGVAMLFEEEGGMEVDEAAGDEENEVVQQLIARRFQARDRRNFLRNRVEETVLDQDMMVTVLIPRVKREWEELANDVFSGTIRIDRLDQTFSILQTEPQLMDELNQMVRCLTSLPSLIANSYLPGNSLGARARIPASGPNRRNAVNFAFDQIKDFMLLKRLNKWLPSILQIHELVSDICLTSLNEDPFRRNLLAAVTNIRERWDQQILHTIPALVEAIKPVFVKFSLDTLDFVAALASSPEVLKWLLAQSSTEEFNRLLQVVRPCTDEPRLLSAIASLVHVRTLLLQPLYALPPYTNLEKFLDAFRSLDLGSSDSGVVTDSALWHVNNVASSFDALMDVFEKQTRSPGIKSCYDLKEIRDRGTFILRSSRDVSQVISVEIARDNGNVAFESVEYLLDLRSKLLMTEVPKELEEEMQAAAMVEAFVQQLQVLSEISDILANLAISGHVGFQENYERRLQFDLNGLPELQLLSAELQGSLAVWSKEVDESRSQYYFLNYFTMREILRMRSVSFPEAASAMSPAASRHSQPPPQSQNQLKAPGNSATAPSRGPPRFSEVEEAAIRQMEQMGFLRDTSIVSLHKCGFDVQRAIDFCFTNSSQMERLVADYLPQIGDPSMRQEHLENPFADESALLSALSTKMRTLDPVQEMLAALHEVSAKVTVEDTEMAMSMWRHRLEAGCPLLSSLGEVLETLFGQNGLVVDAARTLAVPSAKVANRADLLCVLDEEAAEKRLPVFVSCAEDPAQVIDVVLSIYVRRGRLPQPGEVLFCGPETTPEELRIFLLRFVMAKANGRGKQVFCLADLHNLSYTQQCNFIELLRSITHEHGRENCAILVLVSGRTQQMAINALSSHQVDLPPLPTSALLTACREAFGRHCGETECTASTVNGGGKTHHIMKSIGDRQGRGECIHYIKVPMRETTTPGKLVELLWNRPQENSFQRMAYHIDIGHIIPSTANTMLFQLLLVGVLRDPVTCRVFHRNVDDIFLIEIPNSPNNKTALALRVCNFLPTRILEVTAPRLQFVKPIFTDESCTQIRCPEYSELIYVGKWLRAIKRNRLKRGSAEYFPDYNPHMDAAITSEECFGLLNEVCCDPRGPSPRPSWAVFESFVAFMYAQFSTLGNYGLLNNGILDSIEGLENFRTVFVRLLVETTKDFSLRSVPQLETVGPLATGDMIVDDAVEAPRPPQPVNVPAAAAAADAAAPPSAPTRLTRHPSAEVREALQAAEAVAPPALVRQTSEEIVSRFQAMASWEQSDHPIVSFKVSPYDGEVHGIDILSLNPSFVSRYIDRNLQTNLEASGFNFCKDWDKMTNDEGVEILRQIEGLTYEDMGGAQALEAGYVLTIDNVLKMLSIQLRLRFNIPVIIMGETGCGKSTLIRNLCGILGMPLHTMNIHGGIEDRDIIAWMESKINLASQMRGNDRPVIVFLDEINTCNCMGLFKEIVCDHTLNGRPLPNRIKIIAACNPYRLRTAKSLYGGEEMAGLAFETFNSSTHLEGVGTGIKDPLRNLVYRVHPLPESMVDFVYDFGALSSYTESLYIKAMLRRHLSAYNETELLTEQAVAEARRRDNDHSNNPYLPKSPFTEFVDVFAELVCAAQEAIRNLNGGERSSASLRDVSRCVTVFVWFGNHFATTKGILEGWELPDFFRISPKTHPYVRKAVVLSLAYCYYARLPREERLVMAETISGAWRSLQFTNPSYYQSYGFGGYGGGYGYGGYGYGFGFDFGDHEEERREPAGGRGGGGRGAAATGRGGRGGGRGGGGRNAGEGYRTRPSRCNWLDLDVACFTSILEEVQREFVSKFTLGEGIALNEAILENLFMILISVLNQIPIFVIGKPGSSKSLAMGLIQSNLNGDASDNDFLRSLPAVEVFSYQCSPLSTSAGIEQVFESSRRYLREAQNTVVVVLLDEVGLAEQSPHLPLKVLHKMFDQAGHGEGVVGISNWALDPAKMNRAVHLYRPAPTVEDLSLTAEGMVRSANLKGYLKSLAKAYDTTYQNQQHPDFWGLREFYSTVRAINVSLARLRAETGKEAVALDANMLLFAVLRNYGGRPQEMEEIVNCFFRELGLAPPRNWNSIPRETLISQNLSEPDARHLMLLTHNNAALGLLLDRKILVQDHIEVIFGSDFPLDKNDLQICLNLQRIKLCMAEGIVVVLVHCESLFESLYDLLNQHYVEYGGQTYVRLAFGSYTRLCPIHRKFRAIVVVETIDAYTRFAPPLLNRFEKQVFERKDALRQFHLPLVQRLKRFALLFAFADGSSVSESQQTSLLRRSFAGYHSDITESIVLATWERLLGTEESNNEQGEEMEDGGRAATSEQTERVFNECLSQMLWIAAPEATCRLLTRSTGARHQQIHNEFGLNCRQTYFCEQRHSSLSGFLPAQVEWSDSIGSQIVVMTYSPLSQDVGEAFEGKPMVHVVLHELDQERTMRQAVEDFFKSAEPESTLLIQCDPLATTKRRIEHAKFIVEHLRGKYQKNVALATAAAAASAAEREPATERPAAAMPKGNTASPAKPAGGEGSGNSPVKRLHVVFLLHLPRGDCDSDHRFCADFDTRWRFVFVDSIVSGENLGLPNAEDMIGRNMLEIVAGLDMKKVLMRSFRKSIAQLHFATERTNNDVHDQIATILKCLDESEYVKLVHALLTSMLGSPEGKTFGNLSFEVGGEGGEGDHELILAGTFQKALHTQILNTISDLFAIVIGHMDRNATLRLVLQERLAVLWRYLFGLSFNPSLGLMKLSRKQGDAPAKLGGRVVREIVVGCDGHNNVPFTSKFPFSFYVASLVDSMRKATEMVGEQLLYRQFRTINLEFNLHGSLDKDLLKAYVHDFVCMKCREVAGVSRDQQTAMVWYMLEMVPPVALDAEALEAEEFVEEGQLNLSSLSSQTSSMVHDRSLRALTSVHHRFWRIERIVELYFELLVCFPNCIDSVLRFIETSHGSKDTEISAAMHKNVLTLLMSSIEPPNGAIWRGMLQKESRRKASESDWAKDFDDWLGVIDSSRSYIESLTDLIDSVECREEVRARWMRIEFYQAFVQNIAVVLELSPSTVAKMLGGFNTHDIRSHAALGLLLSMVLRLQQDVLSQDRAQHQEFICYITLEVMKDPVIAADGFTYERAAITQWFAQSDRIASPRTNVELESTVLIPNTVMKERIENITECNLSLFVEYFIFEVLLTGVSDGSRILPPEVTESLLAMVAGNLPQAVLSSISGSANSANNAKFISTVILPSHAARVGILQELFQSASSIKEPNLRSRVEQSMRSLLAQHIFDAWNAYGFMDNQLGLIYMTAREDFVTRQSSNESAAWDHHDFRVLKSFIPKTSAEALRLLDSIAEVRSSICRAGRLLCSALECEPGDRRDGRFQEAHSGLNALLPAFQPEISGLQETAVRSFRMFLLKQIERQKGLSYLRSTLLEPPLGRMDWVIGWQQSNDVNFVRFLGANKIPKTNPFKTFPLYSELQEIVCNFLVSGSLQTMEERIEALLGENPTKRVVAALLLAGFHELYLLNVLPHAAASRLFTRRQQFNHWAQHSPYVDRLFRNAQREKAVFLQFVVAEPHDPTLAMSVHPRRPANFLSLDNESTVEDILKVRVAAHLAACTMSCEEQHPLRYFRSLMLQPSETNQSYYPTMPEDVLKMAQDVMGGRWYRCPNQHPYYVDLCGRPTVIQTCKECGAQIGGLSHNLLEDNVDIGNVGTAYYQRTVIQDSSDANYCLCNAAQDAEDKFFSVRSLDAKATRMLRVLLHLALSTGVIALGESWVREMHGLFNKTYCNPGFEEVGKFIIDHVSSNWQLLSTMLARSCDDVSMLIHVFLIDRFKSNFDIAALGQAPEPARLTEVPPTFKSLASTKIRYAWEYWMGQQLSHLGNEEAISTTIQTASQKYGENDEESNGVFMSELLERVDVNTLKATDRRVLCPGLFLYHRKFDYGHFEVSLSMHRGAKERFPLLAYFVEQEHVLRSLRYLPKLLEWFRLLRGKYNGHLDRAVARNKPCGAVLEEVNPEERPRWEEAFRGFCLAWNSTWPSVKKFGCVTFSDDFNEIRMDRTVSISFSLPNELDEGLCPLALVQYITTKHNELVQLVDEVQLKKVKRSRRETTRAKAISSRFLTAAHCFQYDREKFESFIEKQCVLSSSAKQSASYDFAKAESRLIDRYLSNLPAIDLEQSGFLYAHEQQGAMSVLRQKLAQEALPKELAEAIKRDFSNPAKGKQVLEILELVINFVGSTGGAVISNLGASFGDMLLSKYTKTVLLDNSDFHSRVVSQQICLKHLEGLWMLLSELTAADIFAKVDQRYKQPLEPSEKEDVEEAARKLDLERLLVIIKAFVLEHLVNGVYSPRESIFEVLKWNMLDDEWLADVEWFAENFPRNIRMSQMVALYKHLKQLEVN